MISVENGVFKLDTPNTTYLFHIMETGHPVHLYYGPRLAETGDLAAYPTGTNLRMPTFVNYSDAAPRLYMTLPLLETSSWGKGDLRQGAFAGELGPSGEIVFDFTFSDWRIESADTTHTSHLPAARKDHAQTLVLTLSDKPTGVVMELRYTVYEDSDMMVRSCAVINNSREPLTIRSLASLQLDIPETDFEAITFNGGWARERTVTRAPLTVGTFGIASNAGSSSAEHNPLFLLSGRQGCYLFNLLWSGDHRETIEVTPYDTIRVLTGLNPEGFSRLLNPGERFDAPEALMAYTAGDENEASHISHDFISRYITPLAWKNRERPVLLNSWEGMGLDLSEENIIRQAASAKELGVELFVIDDGWFRPGLHAIGSLGDWEPVKNKFPDGMKRTVDAIHDMGMLAGIWVEPECISIDSDLYRAHPEYLVRSPGRDPSPGRDQYLLDYTRDEVVDLIYEKLEKLIAENGFDYVKWDMNRYFSDDHAPNVRGGEFRFRWMLGVYRLLDRFTRRFPDLLLEGCSSGGSRFDPGMLCYANQIWGSDNTDATDRVPIFSGTSCGYPQCCFGAHVSRIPNEITGRVYDYETAFNVNAFGAFGYELDVTKLNETERRMFSDQIAFYKENRALLQFGKFTRVEDGDEVIWTVENEDASKLIAFYLEKRAGVFRHRIHRLVVPSCRSDALYRVTARRQWITAPGMCERRGGPHLSESFERTVPGALLRRNGMALMPVFLGTEYKEDTAFLGDYGSRLFLIEKIA